MLNEEMMLILTFFNHWLTIDAVSRYIPAMKLGLYDLPSSDDWDIVTKHKIYSHNCELKLDPGRHKYLFLSSTLYIDNNHCSLFILVISAKYIMALQASTIPFHQQ